MWKDSVVKGRWLECGEMCGVKREKGRLGEWVCTGRERGKVWDVKRKG